MADESAYRVGDGERRAVDARLQRAHGEGRLSLPEYEERSAKAWAARTRADLEPLTRDLPADTAGAPTAAVEQAPTTALPARARTGEFAAAAGRRAGGILATAALVVAAVWGGSQVLPLTDGVTVFGSRTIGVQADTPRVGGVLLFGSVEVVVPEGTRADVSGFTVFGSTDCPTACAAPGDRTVDVHVVGAFGSVKVLTPAEAATQDRDDD
ncbi:MULTISPECIES: DUF1707 SHOCT-like domain-containing protein [Pseudonocardia]|uniref:DUF1707 SHOCT-like domain-containing protein n=1 Tax=Pseudonocardia TaxID=1847 RepID=UPI001AD7A88C|nr:MULTISPECIES: DUF1707 domain-containing protein [Pseudonocardia]MBO4239262.1 DUF1707 domain-containing protein [Pseudonocardia alni]